MYSSKKAICSLVAGRYQTPANTSPKSSTTESASFSNWKRTLE
ncbi:Uncharacterised protein [Vibrio cholerae]|nr:Uncharacterised protein [Vibrio cholerae]